MKKIFEIVFAKHFLKIGSALSFLLLGVLMFYSCTKQHPPSEEQKPLEESFNYLTLIENWNYYAKLYSPFYTIIGDKAASNNNVRTILMDWAASFLKEPSPEYTKQLNELGKQVPTSTFHDYEKFRVRYRQNTSLLLEPSMDSIALATALNTFVRVEVNGILPNYITSETVKRIIYMNSFCAFFEGEKKRLHSEGIDTVITTCKGLSTGGQFSALDGLIK